MLNDVPSLLSEYMKCFCQSEELKCLLEYQRDLSQLNENGKHAIQFQYKTDTMMLQIHGTLFYQQRRWAVYLIVNICIFIFR